MSLTRVKLVMSAVVSATYPPGPYRVSHRTGSDRYRTVEVGLLLECGHTKDWEAKVTSFSTVLAPPGRVQCPECMKGGPGAA